MTGTGLNQPPCDCLPGCKEILLIFTGAARAQHRRCLLERKTKTVHQKEETASSETGLRRLDAFAEGNNKKLNHQYRGASTVPRRRSTHSLPLIC